MQYTNSRIAITIPEEPIKTLTKHFSAPLHLKTQSSPKNKIARALLFDKHSPYAHPSGLRTKRNSPIPPAQGSISPMSSHPIIKFPNTHLRIHKKNKTQYFSAIATHDSSTPKARKRSLIRNNTTNDLKYSNITQKDPTLHSFASFALTPRSKISGKYKVSGPELEQMISVRLSKCQDSDSRFKVFQDLFEVLISQDDIYGNLLKRVKLEYEEQLERIKEDHISENKESGLYIYKQKIDFLSKENLKLAV